MGKRKRHYQNADEPAPKFGLAAALAHLRKPELPYEKPTDTAEDDDEGWITVGKGGRPLKKQKKEGSDHHSSHHPRRTEVESPKQKQKRDLGEHSERKHSSKDHSNRYSKKANKCGKDENQYPSIDHSHNTRLQSHLKITDLQSLILYILADGFGPQWVAVRHRSSIRQVVVLMVPGLEQGMFTGRIALESPQPSLPTGEAGILINNSPATNAIKEQQSTSKRLEISPDDYYPVSLRPQRMPESLKPFADIFPHVWPIRAVAESHGTQIFRVLSPMHTMLTSQMPKTKEERQIRKNSGHKGPVPQNSKNWENKRTSITEYLADLLAQKENEYVVHPAWYTTQEAKEAAHRQRKEAKQASEDGWVDTNVTNLEDGTVPDNEIEQGSVTAGRDILVIDCEMCKSEDDVLVLTRISMLDWDGKVVLDELVKPDVPIKDYLTQFSGITEAMLKDVTTSLSDIQKRLLEIITPRTILLGHSLNSDFNALKLTHPYIVDSGIIYPHPRGPPYKQSLKWLAQRYLSLEIQKGTKGHDSVQDARACLDLVKQKCERGPRWGTSEANSESIFKRLGRVSRPNTHKSSSDGERYRTGAVVDWGDPTRGHGGQARVAIGCKSDQDVVEGIEAAVKGRATGNDGATTKVDFIWARLRELELVRGWWDDAKTADVEEIRTKALERLGRTSSDLEDGTEVTGSELGDAVARTVDYIVKVFESLPPCTAFIVYSGTSDPREVRRLQNMRHQYQREFATKNWDNLSVKWTDTENQALSQACKAIREGVGFIVVK
ncbi:uncharacterized protein BDR25DRAFT_273783 [Lindgomyces ingoldianus]|uniref:Uncharacterized protein n=1 Tax=Lindgomyces ingoldianus TaxID=673940 RepID=A0ACB6Q810_9PLEO|nr:uncharacterized protein BDR25DRAFT_273783 [Lindgomyces ingoldianus]KAF2463006.1 hypothetical protein BDR25DRAFT_273783 [Lindgomyces ingoldianus]